MIKQVLEENLMFYPTFTLDHTLSTTVKKMKIIFPRNNFAPGDVTYEHAAKSVRRSLTGGWQKRIVIFGDNITRRI